MNLTRVMPAEGTSLSNSSRSFDVAVVGGGVIGLSVAWRAAQRGLSTLVLERGEPGHATSHVAAGMLAPVSEAIAYEEPLLRLGLQSAEMYPRFVEELRDASGLDPGYYESGTLLVARDRDEAAVLDRELALRQRLELPATRLRASEARRLETALAPTLRLALEIPEDHSIDPRKLTAALAAAARNAGAEVRAGTAVSRLRLTAERVTGLALANGTTISAESVVLAAGSWSSQLGGLPPDAIVPVNPVKGQIMRLHDPSGPGLLTRVIRMQDGYLVPRGDGRYVLGATMEERGFDTTVTAGAIYELLRDAIELVPGLDELVLDEVSAGLRPRTPDNTPALGPGTLNRLHWATGHHRGGILLAPVSAQIVLHGITGEGEIPAELDPRRFAADRAAA
jgi:glycine oxidase